MSDNLYPNNPDDMSLDELLEETKRQLDSAPGEMELDEDIPEAMEDLAEEAAPEQEPLEIPETPFFEPDFGDAFKDYGAYDAMQSDAMMENGFAPAGGLASENDVPAFDNSSPSGGYAPVNAYQENYVPQDPYERGFDPEQFYDESPYVPEEAPSAQTYEESFETYEEPYEETAEPEEYNDDYDAYDAYDEAYDADGENAPPPAKPKEKGRKRIIPLFVKVLLYVVIVGLIAVGLGYGAWECAQDFLAFGRSDETITVTIEENDTVDDVAQMLKEKGVIKYPWLFKFYCSFTDNNDTMDPGTYQICYNYDYHALVKGMVEYSPNRSTVRVTIPEGMTCAQIFALMEKNGVCSEADLEECAANSDFGYWFLERIPYGEANRLEGFLFPDTYDFYEADDPERVLDKLLSNFDKKFSEDAQAQLEALNGWFTDRLAGNGYDEDYIASHQIGIYELITIASMIEKETAGAEESGNIASVIYNRLANPEYFPYLNIDAAIVYALGGVDGELTMADLQIDSPYNTYTKVGLPAGPISNPGLSSIAAALHPDDSNYYYYALDKSTGYHHFSETYDEHNNFLAGENDGE